MTQRPPTNCNASSRSRPTNRNSSHLACGLGTTLPPREHNTARRCRTQHTQANTTTARLVQMPAPRGHGVISCFCFCSHVPLSWLIMCHRPSGLQVTVPTFNQWFEDSVAAFQRTAQSALPPASCQSGQNSVLTDTESLRETSIVSAPPSPVATSAPLERIAAFPPSIFGSISRVVPAPASMESGNKGDRSSRASISSQRPKWSTLAQKQCVQKHVVNTYLQVCPSISSATHGACSRHV